MHIHVMPWVIAVDHTDAYLRCVSVSCLLIVVPTIAAGLLNLLLLEVVVAGEAWVCIIIILNG